MLPPVNPSVRSSFRCVLRFVLATAACGLCPLSAGAQEVTEPPLAAGSVQLQMERVEKIWDQGNHNAFTDLIRYGDQWYCCFREGSGHVSPDGALRILSSEDTRSWASAALLTSSQADLRDPKLCITAKGELMLTGAAAYHDKDPHSHQTLAWFSTDGQQWSEPLEIGDPDYWLWRVTWHAGKAYTIGYQVGGGSGLRLYQSVDGRDFETLVADLNVEHFGNEATLRFAGDTAHCLLRRERGPATALWGTAGPPYVDWQWRDLGQRFGGPELLQLQGHAEADPVWLSAGRQYHPKVQTILAQVLPEAEQLKSLAVLPSGGDTSYPGMVQEGDQLFVSYYASHEGRTSIYLAQLQIVPGRDAPEE